MSERDEISLLAFKDEGTTGIHNSELTWIVSGSVSRTEEIVEFHIL